MPHPRQHADAAARLRAYRARQAQARRGEQVAKALPPAPPLPTRPSWTRWDALIEQARRALKTAGEEMRAYHDDRSSAWRRGERGAALRARIVVTEQVLHALINVPEPYQGRHRPAPATDAEESPLADERGYQEFPPDRRTVPAEVAGRLASANGWGHPADGERTLEVELRFRVENSSTYVRSNEKVRQEIEAFLLRRYAMRKPDPDGDDYLLTIPYRSEEELEDIIYDDILREAQALAVDRYCFIEADVRALDGSERSW
jgi:hypothetical protein